jgi:TM2 domain-containing membrane protein YozV
MIAHGGCNVYGVMNELASDLADPRSPGVAAVLSLVIPGVGQIYNGDFLRGIFWLIITPGFWVFSAGLFGWPFHLISSYTAYRRAKLKNRRLA